MFCDFVWFRLPQRPSRITFQICWAAILFGGDPIEGRAVPVLSKFGFACYRF
jgi:hypothetical protein